MIRKQLYLEEFQDRALKHRAKELGVSEAEVVRQALNEFLGAPVGEARAREIAVDGLLMRAEEWSRTYQFPEGYRFDREELYEDEPRLANWRNIQSPSPTRS